ncbi:MAG: hypothetical protein UU65_C0002G0210 [candidate division CPR2 bacterium GW2011_GWC1_41_48]|uniref:Uncharacterized protein n=1 Tax=candidate division CPR2 bacterium GW2011_GWC1_41_48 TaxID=1618344 RepID=A0A0G0WBI9_UNCC2|nr:MAG: hypothetical protein UT47_C0002G0094 [candidate division CPR2 bacterium GW2011_GWC2_39_35]KKR27973.1 MAG: hypothetical protein UT60_C0031G0024 [candidate division CPR2 bacterium GW2011_GWD2_39_7]KKS09432.1 MAG: hypothetical protein UU65_C0002G0210 [candidate division CPR2 bacterium GW2011_GWC1_41_48]OGB72081.1 MAG: hypothetical protein A2Y26_01975 [candidate division CPR2 bacterium GWD2_39_7]
MFKEFEAEIKKIGKKEVTLDIGGNLVSFPKELLPLESQNSGKVYFSLSSEKYSQVVNLLNELLIGSEEEKKS